MSAWQRGTAGSVARALLTAGTGLLLTIVLQACGETASTSGFSGEKHAVAQTIVDFQTAVTGREQKKLCQELLATSVTRHFAGSGGCQAALKDRLQQVDAPGLTIESISIQGKQASARVKSTYSGKSAVSTLRLVKEGGRWRIAGGAREQG